MGPLVPDIISNEFNLVIAFLVGIGFGFSLEQAGFSSSKKLVGLFYGYDFTVLKVFFTAGVVALIGVLILAHFGLLDLQIIYINPTFLWSAIVGGLIMGAGFVIGGFCPGTSVCAAAVGKIDALAFIFGSFLGILIFTEGYSLFEDLYKAENWGAVRMDQFFNISPELFALLLTLVAVLVFMMVTMIENKVNKRETTFSFNSVRPYIVAVVIPFIFISIMSFTPDREEYILQQIAEARQQKKCEVREISADKLAYELVHNHYKINLIDVRTKQKFDAYHLPLSINIPLDQMMNREWEDYFTQKHKINIFYADDDTTAKKACILAKFLGKSDNYILRESAEEFKNLFFTIEPPSKDATKQEFDNYQFRFQAAEDMLSLENALKKFSQPVKKEIRKITGGCS
jgi:rhodanese-related sulfurtransferase